MNYAIATMTVSEFRAFKRALTTLLRAGVQYHEAVDILIAAHQRRHTRAA